MAFHGKNFIGSELSAQGSKEIRGWNPKTGKQLDDIFTQATAGEIDQAARAAEQAFQTFREIPPDSLAIFLETVAREIDALGDALLQQASTEAGLGIDRLTGERARTTNQLRMFAALVRQGWYLDARIDTAQPDRKPLPKVDLRRMLVPLGPVAVFGASNFPLAFSVAGGDTASAFAGRNPVVVKAHPAHPGTSEMVATAVSKAVAQCGLPSGTFSMVHAVDPEVSQLLVKHPSIRAVGFTGSLRGGRAIFDAAASRPVPIPTYCEMGSNNPIFVLPGALSSSGDEIVTGLFNSMTLGVGQFCTSPGVVLGQDSPELSRFSKQLANLVEKGPAGTMLHPSILKGFQQNVKHRSETEGVVSVLSATERSDARTEATPALFETQGRVWLRNQELSDEIFGPSAVLVRSQSKEEMLEIARNWGGTLTATIFGTPEDLTEYKELVSVLEDKAGRIIFNGFPTGVEVTHAMHHGGPYPATTDSKFTSVGTQAILRFLRPVCFQNFPDAALPPELQNSNPRGMWRLVNGTFSKDPI